jgi:hypothetical protein
MTSYRFRRRAFLTALSGGVGLKIMLRNLEGSAQGLRSPARLLVTQWPNGIVAGKDDGLWKPTSGSVGGSPALKPFADLGLGPDMTVIRGLSTPDGVGGSHEQGTVALVTGVGTRGIRSGQQEPDDPYAEGPSYEQILLKNASALRGPGPVAYANTIADSRTDYGEISTKTLSYSTDFQTVATLTGAAREAIPLRPIISPLNMYNTLFMSFVPGNPGTAGSGGGGAGGSAPQPVADANLKKLVGRRSVLDFAVEELKQLKRMAPGEARAKLDIHTDALLSAETSIANFIDTNYPNVGGGGSGGGGGRGGSGDSTCTGTGSCRSALVAPPNIMGFADPPGGFGGGYADTRAMQDDAPLLQQVGNAHLAVMKAAFVCDVIRVGTYQWAPGTNHTGFALQPGTTQPYQHHPHGHRISTADTYTAAAVVDLNITAQFLYNVQHWYFSRHAEIFAGWKNTIDGCGNSLLDFTCVPFLTEVTAVGGERSNMPAMIIGGKQLGFVHDRYVTSRLTINELWGTIAQAYGYASTDAPFAAPVAGLWTKP